MMHELIFHPPAGKPLPFDQVQATLRASDTLAPYLNEEASAPEAAVLTDFDTGAWAILAPAPLEDEEGFEPGAVAQPPEGALLLQIPYLRPRFFAIEGALFATALQQELGYLVEDPAAGDPAPRLRREEEIVASWDLGHREALANAGPDFSPHRIDDELLSRVFSHNLHRNELRHQAGRETEVPRLVLAILPGRKEPAVVARHVSGSALWLPISATHVVLRRPRKSWLGWKEEEVLVEAEALIALLEGERVTELPAGLHGFGPGPGPKDPRWHQLAGREARGLAVVDWNDVVSP